MTEVERSWSPRVELVAPPGRRSELRRRRRRQQRQQIAAALAVAVAATLGLTYALAGGSGPPPAVAVAQERTQRTLLVELQAPNGTGTTGVLLGVDAASRSGAALLLPADLVVPVPRRGPLPLGRALPQVSPDDLRSALGDALDVSVDAGWVLDQPTAVRLVDALGGIEVDMEEPIRAGGRELLPQGRTKLDGKRAVALMSYLGPGEPARTRTARLRPVLEGIVAALPSDAAGIAKVLRGLGRRSVTSLPVPELATFLAGLRSASAGVALTYAPLPVVPAALPTAPEVSRVDPRSVRDVVDRLLAGSVAADARTQRNRVVVLDGVQRPGVADRARAVLADAGLVVVGVRDAPSTGYARSQVVHSGDDTGDRAGDVAAALGLPDDAVRRGDTGDIADVVVLVGADLRP